MVQKSPNFAFFFTLYAHFMKIRVKEMLNSNFGIKYIPTQNFDEFNTM